ncbi:DUF1877 family protein [Paenarthrobacter ureafaciens]|uniref:DUF1877 family protein n=1 Tax=Paenarthrobacter ureafaciens TaxID=37931 RepID=UPI00140B1850|nr:DUF1877 family protein [Paenarthrobacter ureafaciens]MCX8453370.1 DUF1877 family protein [Paenarthrobacter ureafaciens]MCY0972951.1 DUF1877 family protein [Paenarthrobacter ureafaciens]UOD80121.1 YfbM family protein [Paenarthrobacter ureafaciens]WNZ04536.1 DUF1877 family protein [Paenarthrobacter ureafaciens]
MGIRYYAYAFDSENTEQVLMDPLGFVSRDPLADAWGMEPGATIGYPTFKQSTPERDMLYLDKAWRQLQWLTGPSAEGRDARPAFRMFEGEVTMHYDGWESWIRALTPAEMVAIAEDLETISEDTMRVQGTTTSCALLDSDAEYAIPYLRRARTFVRALADEGRGMVYLIG